MLLERPDSVSLRLAARNEKAREPGGCGLVSPLAPLQWIFDCTGIVDHAAQTVILQRNKSMLMVRALLATDEKKPASSAATG
ncbi:MAG TPA: hypothetical protein DIT28_00425 [Oxalobacteraceae bacterium]|nr:hypothetical protein [Oxalobacteraceae bacterium]